MTVKAIREVVNSKKKAEEKEETETEESTENEETVTAENGCEVVSSAKANEDETFDYKSYYEMVIKEVYKKLEKVDTKEEVEDIRKYIAECCF